MGGAARRSHAPLIAAGWISIAAHVAAILFWDAPRAPAPQPKRELRLIAPRAEAVPPRRASTQARRPRAVKTPTPATVAAPPPSAEPPVTVTEAPPPEIAPARRWTSVPTTPSPGYAMLASYQAAGGFAAVEQMREQFLAMRLIGSWQRAEACTLDAAEGFRCEESAAPPALDEADTAFLLARAPCWRLDRTRFARCE